MYDTEKSTVRGAVISGKHKELKFKFAACCQNCACANDLLLFCRKRFRNLTGVPSVQHGFFSQFIKFLLFVAFALPSFL